MLQRPDPLRRLLTNEVERQGQHDDDPADHDDALHDIGPDHGLEAAVGRIGDHGETEAQQAEQVGGIHAFKEGEPAERGPQVIGGRLENRDAIQERLQHQAAGLELGDEIKGHEEDDQRNGQQPEARAPEAVPDHVGDRDGPRSAGHLVEALADEAHRADREDDVAADPQAQDPAVAVDLRWEAREAPSRRAGGREGQGEGPHSEPPVAEKVLVEKTAAPAQVVGDDRQREDSQGVEQEGNQRRGKSTGSGDNRAGKEMPATHGLTSPAAVSASGGASSPRSPSFM